MSNGDKPRWNSRRTRARSRLVIALVLVRPLAFALAAGFLVGYILRSPVLGAVGFLALLVAIIWWRDVHLPRRSPRL